MKICLNTKSILSLAFVLLLVACSERKDGPSEIVNARPISPYYFVKKGETLEDVAQKHSMKEADLIALNNLQSPYKLFERQRILVRVLGENNHDYTKPGSDITVKELDQDDPNVTAKAAEQADDDADNKGGSITDSLASSGDADVSSVDSAMTPFGKETLPGVAKSVVAPTAAAAVAFDWPVKGKILTNFGQKMPDGTVSDSLQISAPVGTKVKAAAAGKVQKAGETLPGFGKIVVVKHDDGKLSLYAHLKEVSAKAGQKITQGQELGRVGKNGAQPMLLFQVRKMVGKKFIPTDPAQFLP